MGWQQEWHLIILYDDGTSFAASIPGLALQVGNIRQDLGSAHGFYYAFGKDM